jgi:ribonuclease D
MLQCLPVPSEFSTLWVASIKLLAKMSIDLSRQIVISFDMEGHADHSYLGMICVLQIATYEMVYLVDCIALFDSPATHWVLSVQKGARSSCINVRLSLILP